MGEDVATGIILGLAVALKLFFGIFFILFLFYRRWRLTFCLLGTFIACNILSIFIFTIPTFKNFLSSLQNMPWYAGSWNASFMGFFTRIFGGSMNIPFVNLPWLARALSFLLSIFLLGSMIWLARPHFSRSESDRFDLVFSLALVQMLLISPYGWLYYFPMLILPMIVAWRISEKYHFGLKYKILIVFTWALTHYSDSAYLGRRRKNEPTDHLVHLRRYLFLCSRDYQRIFGGLLYKINKPLLPGELV